jgi:hypothetical protein
VKQLKESTLIATNFQRKEDDGELTDIFGNERQPTPWGL